MNCLNCGQLLKNDWRNCPFCGLQVEKEKRCINCDGVLNQEWKFCPYCKSPVEEERPDHHAVVCLGCIEEFSTDEKGEVKCPYCERKIHINEDGQCEGVILRCPLCREEFVVGEPGKYKCPDCGRTLNVDEDWLKPRVYVECPLCHNEFHADISDDVETYYEYKCSHCKHKIPIDHQGIIPDGTIKSCPHCSEKHYFSYRDINEYWVWCAKCRLHFGYSYPENKILTRMEYCRSCGHSQFEHFSITPMYQSNCPKCGGHDVDFRLT